MGCSKKKSKKGKKNKAEEVELGSEVIKTPSEEEPDPRGREPEGEEKAVSGSESDDEDTIDDNKEDKDERNEEAHRQLLEQTKQRELGFRKEIERLRSELRANAAAQAPAPAAPAPEPAPVAAASAPESEVFKFDFEVGDDGQIRATDESMRRYNAHQQRLIDQRVAMATQPDPQAELARRIEAEKTEWVAGDPERFKVAGRMEQATSDMALMTEHYAVTNNYQPEQFTDWITTVESTDIAEKFQAMYPEIDDIPEFLEVFFAPTTPEHRIWKVKRYMDRKVKSPGEAQGEAGTQLSEEGVASQSTNVVKLPSERPRSMAQKGRSIEQGTTDKQEFESLVRAIAENPIGTKEDDDYQRMVQLAKKLKIAIPKD